MTNLIKGLSFQTLFDASADAMLLADDAGHIVLSNNAAQRLLDYTPSDLCGLAAEVLLSPRFRENYRRVVNELKDKSVHLQMGGYRVVKVLKHNGKEFPVYIRLSPLKADDRIYTLATLYSYDQHYLTENELAVSEERLLLAKQAASLNVFNMDMQNNVLHCEGSLRELWGAEISDELFSMQFLASIHPDDRTANQAAIDWASNPNGNGEYNLEYRIINPNDRTIHWILALGHMHFENDRAVWLIGILRDITVQKNLEIKLHDLRFETERLFAQQVALQTASAIAHELNQPLAAISAYSEVALHALKSDVADKGNLKKALEGCVHQAQRAGSSLHELLAFLQKGDVVKTSLDINDTILEVINVAKNNNYKGFNSHLQLEQNIPPVHGNRIQVLKIVSNLISNSLDAMHGAGMPYKAITITVRTNKDLNMAHVTVQDKGPGLDKETASRIFEPFFTTKPSGIGMGLAISRALTEANGGQLWLDPNTKEGATFHFTLPFAP